MLPREEFFTRYIISSAAPMISWIVLPSSGIAGDAETGQHSQLQSFRQQIARVAQGVQEPLGHFERRIFAGLRQQNDKLISAIAKGGIDAAHVVLDGSGNLGQQPAAGQMAMQVIDPLEVVEIDKDQAEGKIEAAGALELAFRDGKQVPGIEQAGAVIGDGQFLNALDGAHILNGDRRVVSTAPAETPWFRR